MPYLISLGVGFVVGLLYWLVRVQSPAPPLIALAGLLGMVMGEHAIPIMKAHLFPSHEAQAHQPAMRVDDTSKAGESSK
jgi:XapX domain-containing protein